ncbi:MAG: lytic transglycosylase domain-containing protein [Afipia sp.]|nr:lytic transglycosylase domain-containing protein [Afipia sp.]
MAIDTSTILAGLDSARAKIASSIKNAASATGASFEYLVSTAKMESNFNTSAKASTSSARGLFQFIDQTWLGTVKEAGPKLGFGKYADSITRTADGRYTVSDSATRDEILKLRDDPAAAAAMAGVLTQSNSFKLTGALGRRPTDGELYIAHVMGAGGASKLISNAEDNPNKSGAALFPTAAAANRSIFYDRDGSPRTISQVYSVLTSRYQTAANSQATQTVLASAGASRDSTRVAAFTPVDNAAYLSQFPQVRTPAPAPAVQQVASLQTSPEPMFRSLYQPGDRPEPISPAVRELWGNSTSLTSTLPAPGTAKSSIQMDLFSDRAGVFSS